MTQSRKLKFMAVVFFVFLILQTSAAQSAALLPIPSGASDSIACAIIEQGHRRGIELWNAKNLSGALEMFQACETALRQRSYWSPPRLPANPSPLQRRTHLITNAVIFSLASIYQQMDRSADSERYAEMARERMLLPKVVRHGSRGKSG